jgi:serine/tyrosine/threonine adenylyltransferase
MQPSRRCGIAYVKAVDIDWDRAMRVETRFIASLPGDHSLNPQPRQVHGALYSLVQPTPVKHPRLIVHSPEVAALLECETEMRDPEFIDVLAGNRLLDRMTPYAANYGGHQFGHWAGQLGDGRAITLGECVNSKGERYELQLKGAGPTPYSRTADGRAVLRSSVREFLCSEAMFHLGVPTTRALSLVLTGDSVVRDMFYDGHPREEPGAIVCRVAPSFIRFGNFELPAARGDIQLLEQLIDYTIEQHFPEITRIKENNLERRGEWFAEVCRRTALMIVHWMRVGFVHGVMNTDNMSILGLTIDYGPYGWIDNFDPEWTPNTTDAETRRYRFGQQPQIAYWNLAQLANALFPAFGEDAPLNAGLELYARVFNAEYRLILASKVGFAECSDEDLQLIHELHEWLQATEVDMTIFFRKLVDLDLNEPDISIFAEAYYDDAKRVSGEPALVSWIARYVLRSKQTAELASERKARMNRVNPRYVLRNYLAQEAIDRAEAGDYQGIQDLLEALRNPYDDQPGREHFAQRRPDWARNRAGCSMLSCSS